MKIMTFNTQHCLNFIKREIDFDIMADAIRRCGADIVALNEMRGAGSDPEYTAQTERLSELTGLEYFYFAKAIDVEGCGPYGNAILSRFPIESAETIAIPDPVEKTGVRMYETRCILRARIEGGLTVLVTHFGLNPDEQRSAVETVLNNLADERCVLMGDFNATPDNEVLKPIRERMTDASDFIEGNTLTFRSDCPDRKIDYVFVTKDVRVLCAEIPEIIASDHRPHTATISY